MPATLESLNQSLFLTINAGTHPPVALYWFARFSAEILIYVLAAGLVIGWLRGRHATRRGLVYAGLAAVAALAINQLIGLLWYHPRPFEIGLGHTLMAHSPETSFPSDHVTVFCAVTLALLRWPALRRWGLALIPACLLVAWSRIWLGVHFPMDMLGSLLVSAAVVLFLHRPMAWISAPLNQIGETWMARLRRHT